MGLVYSVGDNPIIKDTFRIESANIYDHVNFKCYDEYANLRGRTVIKTIYYAVDDPQLGAQVSNMSISSQIPYPNNVNQYYIDFTVQKISIKGTCSQDTYEYLIKLH